MRYKLGKRVARHAIALAFSDVFDASKLPVPPPVFGHESIGRQWGMLGNDEYGDCVFAGAAHETMVFAREGGNNTIGFSTFDVLQDYAAVTGFDPRNPDSDQGTDMQAAASYRRKTGVRDGVGVRHKIDAYLALQVGNWDQLMIAMYLFGAAGIGVQLPDSAEKQFDAHMPWTVVKGAQIEGGHYISGVGRNSHTEALVVTWGRLQAMSRDFYERFNDEGCAYVSLEILNAKGLSPEGYDQAGLRKYLASL